MADGLSPELSSKLLDYERTLDCVHCGLCLPHCPTYQETGRETSSPRGRIYMMRGVAEGRLAKNDAVVAREMYYCLACRACESACPAGVEYGRLVEGMRAELDAAGARPRLGRLVERFALRQIVGRRGVLRAAAALLRGYQRSGVQTLVRRLGLLRLAPPLARAEAGLPRLPDPHRPPIIVPARGQRRGRVAFFAGCVMPELFAGANADTVFVLAENGFEVQIPREQVCCGALHLHSGDPEGAERLQLRNRAAFRPDDFDAVISNSAGCGAALKEMDDALGRKMRDWSEFLDQAGLRPPMGLVELRVAYDDACHLLHGQRLSAPPRRMLAAIPGLDLFDLPGSSDCCGAAGTYSLTHPETSRELRNRKVRAILDTRPDAVATGNPGCLMQIGAGVREAGLCTEVLHPAELLARSYQTPEESP